MMDFNSQVVAGIEGALILTGDDARVVFANECSRRLFGRDLTGSVLRPEEVDEDLPIVASMVQGFRRAAARPGAHRELVVATTPEGPRYFWLGVSPRDGDGGGSGAARLVSMIDITESLSGSPSLQRIFSQVNHDIRSPLTSISGAAELLQSGRVGALDGVQQRLLGIIGEGVRKIDDILARTKSALAEGQVAAVAGEGREQR